MTLEEKYNHLKKEYLSKFIVEGLVSEKGTYIPLEKIVNDVGYVGDGTINLAHYLTWALLNNDNDRVEKGQKALYRLTVGAYLIYSKFKITFEPGFFLRDDIDLVTSDKISKNLNLSGIISGYKGSIEGFNEDTCYSPFVSQDQCWNLFPPLKIINSKLGYDIFEYIIRNKHVIYNPYLSQIIFNNNYLNLKVPFYDRLEDRHKHLKYKIRVKRGANNWYFSYGFKKAFQSLNGNVSKWNLFKSALWYKPFIFLADRFWHPYICKWFHLKVKNTSYYALGLSSNAWYFGNVHKRFIKLFNKSLSKGNIFNPELLPYVDKKYWNLIDKSLLEKYLDNYTTQSLNGTVYSPIIYMILYSVYVKL